jgi:DNA polymerase-1
MSDLVARRDLAGVSVRLVERSDEIPEFKRWLGERRAGNVLAVDLETTGLDPYTPVSKIRLAQLGDAMAGWAIPWDRWPGLVTETLGEYTDDIVLHNAAFDIKWLEEHSSWRAPWGRIHDTMLAARLVNPLLPAGLKPLSDRYIDRRASYGQHLLDEAFVKNGWDWDTVPVTFEPYWTYGALDTVLAARLHEMYQQVVAPGKPYHEAYELEMSTLRITTRMEQRGARVDLDYARAMYEKCFRYEDAIRQWARDAFHVDIGSPSKLARKFKELGGDITILTPRGHPKVDKWQLKIFADPDNGYPLAVQKLAEQTLLQRKYSKLASSYFNNFVEKSRDGLIHANINPFAARTGRMSISNPALQQLPRGDATVRRAIIPREGNALVCTDFSQIEMRMLGHFSGDPELQHAFADADATGGDFFVNIGREVYKDPTFSKADKRRNLIKSTMYGKAYGAGVAKMAETAGVPVERMKEVSDALTARYPGIKNFMSEVEDIGKRRENEEGEGYVMGIDGRRLPCDTGRVYTLVNYLIQGGAAVAYKRALLRLDAAGYSDYFLVPVHDEIVMDIPQDAAAQALIDVPEIMKDTSFAVEIPADPEGPFLESWGEKYAGK